MIFKPQFIQSDIPLSEYPRPQFKRDSYFTLNGEWEYAITDGAKSDKFDGKIIVPYSPECQLSGVLRQLKPNQTLFYLRRFT